MKRSSETPDPNCDRCGGTGEVDSGGFSPQGHPLYVPCDCNKGIEGVYFDELNLATEFAKALAVTARYQGVPMSWADASKTVLVRVFPFLGRYKMRADGPMRWKCEDSDHPELAIVFTRKELAETQLRDWVLIELDHGAPKSTEGVRDEQP